MMWLNRNHVKRSSRNVVYDFLCPQCRLGRDLYSLLAVRPIPVYCKIMKHENSNQDDGSSEVGQLFFSHIGDFIFEAERRAQADKEKTEGPPFYRLALGRELIHLDIIEFRILLFLASKPYHPFTRRCITDAVSTERHPVTEDTVDQHIVTLRDQLGPFHDYIQSVPYIGYRFKA